MLWRLREREKDREKAKQMQIDAENCTQTDEYLDQTVFYTAARIHNLLQKRLWPHDDDAAFLRARPNLIKQLI